MLLLLFKSAFPFILTLPQLISAVQNVSEQFEMIHIAPGMIEKAPANLVKVTYGTVLKPVLGNVIKPAEVKRSPVIKFIGKRYAFHALFLIDFDVPCENNEEERKVELHWLVVNIPGNNMLYGETLSEYIRPMPPKDTGFHRYVFLLFRQPKRMIFDEPALRNRDPKARKEFSIKYFVLKYNLGNPIAGNYFFAEWDNSFLTSQKQTA